MKKLYALRGATQCENTTDDICGQVSCLYDELLCANRLEESEIVSVIFSVTGDLNAANPCSALRKSGRAGELSLFTCLEPDVQGGIERVCRVLIHCYLEEGAKPNHVYRNGAEVLRPDRVED